MKVLVLGWELPPHNSGGLGVACYHMCRALSSQGADIDFIVPYTSPHKDIEFMNVISAVQADVSTVQKDFGVYDSSRLGDSCSEANYDYHRIYEESIQAITQLADYDVIHAFDWLTIRPAIRAKQLTGKPLIVNIHSLEYDRAGGKRGNPDVWDIEYQGMMMADRVVTVSEYTRDVVVREYNIPYDKVEVVHNSFDLGLYEGIDGQNAYKYLETVRKYGYKVVMYVGRMTIQKNLHNLILAFKKVVEIEPKTILLLVGSGDQEIELIEKAAELGISKNVIFAGFQRGKYWRDAFGVCDLTVMPSASEPFGLTALESAGFGVPTLVSKQSGVHEVLKSALKIDYWDVDGMANQILGVIQNQPLQDQLIEDGLAQINKLTWTDSAEKLLNIYNQLSMVAS